MDAYYPRPKSSYIVKMFMTTIFYGVSLSRIYILWCKERSPIMFKYNVVKASLPVSLGLTTLQIIEIFLNKSMLTILYFVYSNNWYIQF